MSTQPFTPVVVSLSDLRSSVSLVQSKHSVLFLAAALDCSEAEFCTKLEELVLEYILPRCKPADFPAFLAYANGLPSRNLDAIRSIMGGEQQAISYHPLKKKYFRSADPNLDPWVLVLERIALNKQLLEGKSLTRSMIRQEYYADYGVVSESVLSDALLEGLENGLFLISHNHYLLEPITATVKRMVLLLAERYL